MRTALRVILCAALVSLTATSLFVFVQNQTDRNFFGDKFFIVLTDSSKYVAYGDFVVVDENCGVCVSDCVAAQTARGVTVGVIKKEIQKDGVKEYVLETDVNGLNTVKIINSDAVLGKYKSKIGFLGSAAAILKQNYFVLLIFGLFLLCCCVLGVLKPAKIQKI